MKYNRKHIDWKMTFIALVCIISLCISVVAIIYMMQNSLSIDTLAQKLNNYTELLEQDNNSHKADAYLDFCESINSRVDSAITELLTIVGIFASIITILGVLLTFKAPKDIEKQITELRDLFDKTNNIVEEQEYLLMITDAVKEKTTYHRIRSLTNIITKHPNRWQAYLYRGSEYDDKKDYDKAIKDYTAAKEYGCDIEIYYNNMSIALSNRYKLTKNYSDQKQAVVLISKAIELNPEDASYYNNRGSIYEEMKKYELAKSDFDTAVSIDPDNYEAYANIAKWYFTMLRITDDVHKKEEYRNQAISSINKALDLNYEDSQNLKQLSDLLTNEHSSNIEIDSIIDLLIKVNERSGDIDFEETDYINAISGYSKALSVFNGAPDEIINSNIEVINRICDKIYNCKTKIPNVDVTYNLGRKLLPLLFDLNRIAFDYYSNNDFKNAGLFFEFGTILEGFGTVSSNNLAYMIRRGEYHSIKHKISDLLSCKSMEDSSSFLRINRALCHIIGNDFKKDVRSALQEISMCDNDLDKAIEWWGNEDMVGKEESNLVLVLLSLMEKLELDENSCDIQEMIETAIRDGYEIPTDIIDIAIDVKDKIENSFDNLPANVN